MTRLSPEAEAYLLEKQRERKRISARKFRARHKGDPAYRATCAQYMANYRAKRKLQEFN